MKAARFYSTAESLRIEEIPNSIPGEGEVVIAVKAAGVCGTDLHIARRGDLPVARSPITLGHEAAGIIAQVGEGVAGWKEGDRVAIFPCVSCGTCDLCQKGLFAVCPRVQIFGVHRDGTFAEYVKVPASCLVALPETIPFEVGAILSDAVATAYHAVRRRAALKEGETVAVFGCGGVGYHGIKVARLLGAGRIFAIDTSPGALRQAEKAGANELINAQEEKPAQRIRAETHGEGVDVALEFVGSKTVVAEALHSVRRTGRVVVVGVGSDRVELPPLVAFVGKELSLIRSMGYSQDDLTGVLALMTSGRLDLSGSVTDRFPLDEVNNVLERLEKKTGDPVRLVIVP